MIKCKLFYSVFFLAISFSVHSQQLFDDFEGNGNISTWTGDDCGIDTNFTNPFVSEQNPSATVLRYSDVGGQYANIRFDAANKFDMFNHHVFEMKIFVPSNSITGNQPNQISLKLQNGQLNEPWTTQSEIIKPLQLNQWQTVIFNFSQDNFINLDGNSPNPLFRNDFDRVVIQLNGENNNDLVMAYIDDFMYDMSGNGDEIPVFDHLVWSDEFDINGAIDSDKWFHQTQLPNGGSWYNSNDQITIKDYILIRDSGIGFRVCKKAKEVI
jgi:hypothetical protein